MIVENRDIVKVHHSASNRVTGLALVGLLIFSGCHCPHKRHVEMAYPVDQPAVKHVDPDFYELQPRRVVLMIPSCRENSFEVQQRFATSLATSMSRLGVMEVIPVFYPCEYDLESIRNGDFDDGAMLEITNRANADGILFCEVNSLSAYEPLQLGCSLTLLDTREMIVTLHVSGVWDTDLEHVRGRYSQYVCRVHECRKHAATVYMQSPSQFFEFVADDLANVIQEIVHQE